MNRELKKAVENYGLCEIDFEWNDQKAFNHVGKNHVWLSNYVDELVREFPMHYPSWHDIEEEKKAYIHWRLMQHGDLEGHMCGPCRIDIP
ncbi:hypothetical protein Tco_0350773 [Tanacetum coccineum]